MRIASFAFAIIIASLTLVVQGCDIHNSDPDTAILGRLSDARAALDAERSSYAEISRDPVSSAHHSAARGDHRLIAFYYYALGADHTPRFPGLRCSIPNELEPIVQRAVWSHYVNDAGPSGPQPNRQFAERYNRAMVMEKSFPFGDLCVVDPSSNPTADPSKPIKPYFSRLSSRKALPLVADEEVVIAIRNGEMPDFTDSAAANRPDAFGLTPLAWAGMRGARNLVVQLLAKGADPWAGARCFVPPGKTGDVFYDDRFYTPLALTSRAGHSDIVDLMLTAKPQKKCPQPPDSATTADAELKLMLDMGRALGDDPGHHRLFNYALSRVLRSPEAYSQNDPFEELVEHGRDFDLTEAFRAMSKAEAERNRKALLSMAAGGTIDELRYWVGRLNVQNTEDQANLLYDVTRNMTYVCSETQKCGRDGDVKLGFVLDRIGRPTVEENVNYVLKVFGDNLGPLDRDPAILKRIVTSFTDRGFSFNVGNECMLILNALSYSYSDECPHDDTSPAFAALLLDLQVDVRQRTPSGLTSLDLAKRRSDKGPYPEAFAPIAAELNKRGVPETNRPMPER